MLNTDSVGKVYASVRLFEELGQKLTRSFQHYKGKDALLLVVNHGKMCRGFSKLTVKKVALDQLCPPPVPLMAATGPTSSPATPPSSDISQRQYTHVEIDAALVLQHRLPFWCKVVKEKRERKSTAEGQAMPRFIGLGKNCAEPLKRVAIRGILTTVGVEASLKLGRVKEALILLQKDVIDCIEHVELSQGLDEIVDSILTHKRDAEALVALATEKTSDTFLEALVRAGVAFEVQQAVLEVEDLLQKAERAMDNARKAIDTIPNRPAQLVR